MFFKRFMAVVLTMAMLCSSIAFAEGQADLLISPAPATGENAPVLTQEQINKNATGFTDITADAPYAAAVKKLVDFGIIAGYPDGTFKPQGEVTRAEMCKMINLTLGYTDFDGAQGFPDVTVNNWYYAFALAAQKQGYVKGYEDMSFRGSNNITRQEVCAILDRLLKPMNLGIPVVITDAVSNWARPHVELIVQNFIMPLEANNTFRATENLKRHELATVLANMAIGPVKQIEADVRFFVNGEQYGETQVVSVGNVMKAVAAPTPPSSSYIFEGWRKIGTDEIIDINTAIVISDVDYEAVFVKKLHDVTFYSRGAEYSSCVVIHGGIAEAPNNPSVKGYEFLGWSLSEDGDIVKLSETKIMDNVKFYAVFEKESGDENGGEGADEEAVEYKVRFFVNGDLYQTQTVSKNFSPDEPYEPFREGYEFLGWSLTSGGEIVDVTSLRVTKNMTLYAVFEGDKEDEPEVYTVTFYVEDEKYETQFVEDGNTVEPVTNPEMEGYVFKYWSRTPGGSEVKLGYFTVSANTNFYAVFEEEEEEVNYFNVIFMVEGVEYSRSRVQEGKKASAPTAPTMEGYTFKGWSKSEGGSVSSVSVPVTSDLVFYAVFEEIKLKEFTVTFYVDDAVYEEMIVLEKQTADIPENPTKEGYTFKGWSETNGGTVVNVASIVINSSKNFYAVFEKKKEDTKSFTIKFVVDGKTYDSQEVLEKGVISIPADPEKDGYEFLGWSKTDGGRVVSVATSATENVTYYAVFEQIKKYTVTFYVDGTIYKSTEVVENETASAPNVSLEEYNFLGWSMTEGGAKVNVGSVKIKEDTDFYALLEKKEEEKEYYSVVFKVDGKNYATESVEEGSYVDAPETEPEKEGYTFKGWSKTSTGSVIDVTSVEITANTTFYAIFEKDPVYYEVVFMVDGEEYDTQEVLEGEYPEVPNDPVLKGYEFLGWSKTEGGSTVYPERTQVKADTTYYAVFEEAEEEIVYYRVLFWFDGEVYKDYDVAEGDTVKAPEIPELEEGMLFFGWALDKTIDPEEVIEVSDIIIENHTDFYAVLVENPNSEEFMEKLTRGYAQLKKIRATGLQKEALGYIKECIGYILEDANSGIEIDKNYVSTEYEELVNQVKKIINVDMLPAEVSQFAGLVTKNVDDDVREFLMEYFDIDY